SREMGEIARAAGCAFGQGYAYGAPAPAEALARAGGQVSTPRAMDVSPVLAASPAFAPKGEAVAAALSAEHAEVVIIADESANKSLAKGKGGKSAKPASVEKPKRGLFSRRR
ncbi:MAG: hypothetical protein K2Q06_11370, partial [Parvularculaceae bacterium]|nr:hypothetical protein [Parvularculaceae bacterium]